MQRLRVIKEVLTSDRFHHCCLCIDCSVDTIEICEYYMVHNKIWPLDKTGMLCIKCLEKRIKRRLKPEDFMDVFCHKQFVKSDRLCNRMGVDNERDSKS